MKTLLYRLLDLFIVNLAHLTYQKYSFTHRKLKFLSWYIFSQKKFIFCTTKRPICTYIYVFIHLKFDFECTYTNDAQAQNMAKLNKYRVYSTYVNSKILW